MNIYEEKREYLRKNQKIWLVTGVAGFIGSNLLEHLLLLGQKVIGLDNFSNGHKHNLEEVRLTMKPEQWNNFTFIHGDIRHLEVCVQACKGADFVLHQGALGSVPRSINDPITTNEANIVGFLNMLVAARDASVGSFVYAASSSTYGDHPALPKVEETIGNPLSPYAVTKYVNELYADVFYRTYGLNSKGLRYFNVFGKRQDPNGAYAAVIPKWTSALIAGETVFINGDGETSRDFCYIENVVQANILAALDTVSSGHEVYNIAVGDRNSLNKLYSFISSALSVRDIQNASQPTYRDFRDGDVRHSQASIIKASTELGYSPKYSLREGLEECMDWYIHSLGKSKE